MTDYEKRSLQLLGAIAQGIGLLLVQARCLTPVERKRLDRFTLEYGEHLNEALASMSDYSGPDKEDRSGPDKGDDFWP